MIDVKAEKLASRRCEKCGNMVVFDQSKGEKAVCPVCGEAINTPSLQRQNTEVACEQCGLTLNVEKTATTAVCPLCGHANDMAVALVMAQVKSGLSRCIRESAINILEVDEHLTELSQALCADINRELAKYGLEAPEFIVSRVVTPDDDPNYQRLRQQHADLYLKVREEQIRKREAEAKAERMAVEAEAKARVRAIEAGGEAEAVRRMAAAEAEKMRMQGYTYQQETQRQVGKEAMKHGIVGSGGGSGGGGSTIGEVMQLGLALGMMGPVSETARQAIAPAMGALSGGGAQAPLPAPDTWDCPNPTCGAKALHGHFCPECGTQRPAPTTWDCACGAKGLRSKFCPNCGAKRP